MMKPSLLRPRILGALLAAVGVGALLVLPVSAQRGGGTLIIKGSDTMVNLSQAWAEALMQKKPGAAISVTGGGSGTGIAAFLNGTCDIANSSRPMSVREIDQAKQRNVLPKGTTCALDGLAIAVHSSNPLDSIAMDQIASIFMGKTTDWSKVNGRSGRIVALSRESNSGTHVYFKEHVLNNAQYGAPVLFMPSTKAIQQEISNNAAAIGYGGEAYFKNKPNVKILPVSPKKGAAAVYPSNENVANKSYPIARGLYMYTPGSPKGLAGEFIKFTLSPEGQRIVQQIGYVPLPYRRASQ